MLPIRELVLALLLGLPAWHGDDESRAERTGRMGTVATAVDWASERAVCAGPWRDCGFCERIWPGSQLDLALLLVTQGFWETRFARHVHAGKCKPKECGGGAWVSPWQLASGDHLPLEEWKATVGLGLIPTTNAAWAASRALAYGRNRCRSIRGAVAMYSTGSRCTWNGSARRVAFYQRLRLRAGRWLRARGHDGRGYQRKNGRRKEAEEDKRPADRARGP